MVTRRVCLLGLAVAALGCVSAPPARSERAVSRAELRETIRECNSRSDRFRRTLRRALDRSRLDGTRREDDLNDLALRLGDALDDLRRELGRGEDRHDTRDDVERALDAARGLDRGVERFRLGRDVDDDWRLLRRELDRLADAYRLPPVR